MTYQDYNHSSGRTLDAADLYRIELAAELALLRAFYR